MIKYPDYFYKILLKTNRKSIYNLLLSSAEINILVNDNFLPITFIYDTPIKSYPFNELLDNRDFLIKTISTMLSWCPRKRKDFYNKVRSSLLNN